MRPLLSAVVLASALVVLIPPRLAYAQDSMAEAQAQRLFDEGRALMEQSRFAEACAKFHASERIVSSGGTLLNLADCYEKDGKTASAWARFKEVAARAAAAKRPDLESHALARAAALVPRLSTITVIVPQESDIPNLTVKRVPPAGEAAIIDRAAWGTALPLDPASYTIEASAPGRTVWTTTITITTSSPRATVTIPKLEQDPSSRAIAPPPPPSHEEQTTGWPTQKKIGLGVAAVGVIGLGVGGFFGLRAIGKNDDAKTHCPQSPSCLDAEGPVLTEDARSAATISTISFIAGGALLIGAAVLWFTSPSSPTSSGSRITGRVTADATGIRVWGSF